MISSVSEWFSALHSALHALIGAALVSSLCRQMRYTIPVFWRVCDVEHDTPNQKRKEKKGKLIYWQWQRSQQPNFGTRGYKLERRGRLWTFLFTNLNWQLLPVLPVTLYNTHSCPHRHTLSFFFHIPVKVVLHRITDSSWHRSFTYSFTPWSSQMLIHHLFVMILSM